MANLTLLDIAKINGNDAAVPLIEATIKGHPETNLIAARTINGTSYKTLIRESYPTVAFRHANEGAATVKSRYGQRLVETFIIDVPVEMDKAVADAHEDGAAALLAMEAQGQLEATFQHIATQLYYGRTGGDAKGFPGAKEVVDATNVIDATGAGGDTSTVWAFKWTNANGVKWVMGANGSLTVSDVETVRLDDGTNPYTGYRQYILGYIGAQFADANCLACIKNIDGGAPLTDDLLYQLLEVFPAGMAPDGIFMSRRSLRYLRESRTATNATGAPAPLPTLIEGIPLYATDALSDAETAW